MKVKVRRRSVHPGPAPAGPEAKYDRALALARNGREKNASRVLPLLRDAANAGHAMAAHALATWYIHGIGVRRDFATAAKLEAQASRAGVAEAAFNLAYSYESGKGVEKDERRALRLYRRAARLGDADAVYEVGRCIFYGIGAPKNERLGQKWIDRAGST